MRERWTKVEFAGRGRIGTRGAAFSVRYRRMCCGKFAIASIQFHLSLTTALPLLLSLCPLPQPRSPSFHAYHVVSALRS